jgi:hypothetical protein
MTLPKRIQADLQAAEALETQEAERRAAVPTVSNIAELLTVPDTPPIVAPVPAAPAAPQPAPPEDFEAKFKTLQGMYSADVTRVRQQATEQARVIGELRQAVEDLKQARTVEPPAAPQGPDPKDVEAFGADILDMVQRYVTNHTTKLEDRLAVLERQVTGVSQETAEQKKQTFYTLLDQLVPPWKQINVDARWLAWLEEEDPVYQIPRNAALMRAFELQDAQKVANIFKAFVASLPPPPAPAPAPASLENQVAPSSAASAPPQPAVPKPLITSKAIDDFYKDLYRGVYEGKKSEADAMEALIHAAVAEGRVV